MKKIVCSGLMMFICIMCMTVVSCKKTEKDAIDHGDCPPAAPEALTVSGVVTDESGVPLQSIRISMDSTGIERDEWGMLIFEAMMDRYSSTNQNGEYYLYYTNLSKDIWPFEESRWPSEVTIIACDPSGIYEDQTQTVPVDVRRRFPDCEDCDYGYQGYVTADFQLHKK